MDKETAQSFQIALMELLKETRKSKSISHEKLAELSGVSRQAISKIEAGQRNPTMLTVYKLVSAMGLSLADFAKKLDI